MQGRKKKYSQKSHSLRQQPNFTTHTTSTSPLKPKPFQQLWSASQSLLFKNYDAMTDPHTSYYFTSPSIVRHCKQLSDVMKQSSKSKSNLMLCKSLKEKKKEIKISIAKMMTSSGDVKINENIKILPYTNGLKQHSKIKLQQFRRNLKEKLKQKQKQHRQFLKIYTGRYKPQKPQIRLIKTLQPIQNLSFVQKCQNIQQYGRNVMKQSF